MYRHRTKARSPGRVAERTVQFTVRGVPIQVERAFKRKAAVSGKSLNGVLGEALTREAGIGREIVYHDLDALAGKWKDDPQFDEALRAQHEIDQGLWK
jgi:hypothetical protein